MPKMSHFLYFILLLYSQKWIQLYVHMDENFEKKNIILIAKMYKTVKIEMNIKSYENGNFKIKFLQA